MKRSLAHVRSTRYYAGDMTANKGEGELRGDQVDRGVLVRVEDQSG